MKQIKKCLSFTFFAAVVCSVYISLGPAPPAYAAYDGGRLIDNNVFLDANSMNQTDIQNFLTSKGSALASRTFLMDCPLTTMSEPYYRSLGAPCGQYIPAAQIIYYAAQIYGINPKVVLATLQKEQSLITNPYPSSWNINQAMGYGCPTTGSCNDASGFLYQVDNGVWLLRYHMERARGNLSYWWQSTSWNPCGSEKNFYKPNLYPGQDVRFYDEDNIHYRTHYIANAATSSMYCYTPHAYNNPNGLYGKPVYGWAGRYYSGSYNFVYYYERWFGSTIGQNWAWQPTNQTVFTDQTKTTQIGWHAKSLAGQMVYVQVKARNTGAQTWSKSGSNPVLLGTWGPQDRVSSFCYSWVTCNRAATLIEESVQPGDIGTFEFWMKAPSSLGSYRESFNLVVEGITWFNNAGMFIDYEVQPVTYSWAPGWQQAYYDDTKTKQLGWHASVIPGQKFYFLLKAKNIGNVPWKKDNNPAILLGTWNPQDANSPYCTPEWLRCNRISTLRESIVNPGETGTFEFWMQAPSKEGHFSQFFNMVAEGVSWMDAGGVYVNMIVKNPVYSWQPNGQSVWTDQTKTTHLGWNGAMQPGGRNFVEIYAKNTGNVPWVKNGANPTLIGTWHPQDRVSQFYDSSWIFKNRMALQQQDIIYPGETATYQFWLTAPSAPGTYSEYFNLVVENKTWFNPTGQFFTFIVK